MNSTFKKDAFSQPVLDIHGGIIDDTVSEVMDTTAYSPGLQTVAAEGARFDLHYLRMLFPYLPIIPFPDNVATVVCTAANTPYNIDLPDGTVIANFDADGTDWWLSNFGACVIPTAHVVGGINISDQLTPLAHPSNWWFYTGSARQFSVASTTPGRIVQAKCYYAKQRPKPAIRSPVAS